MENVQSFVNIDFNDKGRYARVHIIERIDHEWQQVGIPCAVSMNHFSLEPDLIKKVGLTIDRLIPSFLSQKGCRDVSLIMKSDTSATVCLFYGSVSDCRSSSKRELEILAAITKDMQTDPLEREVKEGCFDMLNNTVSGPSFCLQCVLKIESRSYNKFVELLSTSCLLSEMRRNMQDVICLHWISIDHETVELDLHFTRAPNNASYVLIQEVLDAVCGVTVEAQPVILCEAVLACGISGFMSTLLYDFSSEDDLELWWSKINTACNMTDMGFGACVKLPGTHQVLCAMLSTTAYFYQDCLILGHKQIIADVIALEKSNKGWFVVTDCFPDFEQLVNVWNTMDNKAMKLITGSETNNGMSTRLFRPRYQCFNSQSSFGYCILFTLIPDSWQKFLIDVETWPRDYQEAKVCHKTQQYEYTIVCFTR